MMPIIEEQGKTRVTYHLRVVGSFSEKNRAQNVVFTIPAPPNTAEVSLLSRSLSSLLYPLAIVLGSSLRLRFT